MPITDAATRLWLLVALWLLSSAVLAAPRIGVATMQPGEIFWERFGHNAIVVDDPARGEPVSYNFGFFDLAEPGFVGRFVHGEMEYMLVALPLAQDMAYYRDSGRGVSIQWLDLEAAEASRLAAALAENARPENARYRYDYFTDNCSTRVRDPARRALGGKLRSQLEVRSLGNTYRSEAVRLASPASWMWLGFDLGLGPFADRPLSRWQDAFVPMHLADGLRIVKRADGRPLVIAEQPLLPHRIAPEPRAAARAWWPWLLSGLGIAGALYWLDRSRRRLLGVLAIAFWTLCGIAGLLMAFIWCCTAHRAGWSNHNLLLLSPLCLLLLPGALRVARGVQPGRWFGIGLLVIAAGALGALLLHWLPIAPQRNGNWIGLLLPTHLALAYLWAARQPHSKH